MYVEVDGAGIGRADDAAWCLDWLDQLESVARAHGHFSAPEQLGDLVEVLDAARGYYRHVIGVGATGT